MNGKLSSIDPGKAKIWLNNAGFRSELEFWASLSGISENISGTVNDYMDKYFSSLGYTGTINDKFNKFLRLNSGVTGTVYDMASKIFETPYSIVNRLKSFGGLTFAKDYANSQSTANADFSVGSGTVTVTAARSTSAPGTYFNSTGGILSLTTANVPRFTQGFYDHTGFVSRPGLMIESGGSASTGRNVVIQSQTFSDAAWTKTNITVNDAESDGVLTTTVSSITASAVNATLTQAFVLGANIFTGSIFIKRKTGTGTISLRANTADAYTDITANVGSSWTRVQVTSSSAANPTFDLKISTNGDAVYIYGAQIEQFPYATSHIPTLTAARTRAAELVVYNTSGNRTASDETSFVKVTPLGGDFVNDSIQRTIMNTSTKNRQIYKVTTSSLARIAPNLTDNSGVAAILTTALLKGVSYVIGAAATHTTPLPYARISLNGTTEGNYTAGDWTDVAWGTTWTLGATAGGASQLNGIVESIAIYSSFKDVPDTNHISNILSSSVSYTNYLLQPDASSASNVVSGSTTGNVIDNTTYDFNGHLVRTGTDTVIKFDVVGSDEDFNLGLRLTIKARTFTISTSTWGADSVVYDITSQPYVIGSRIYRVVGTQIWMYMVKYSFPLDGNGILVLSKSTDLTGTSWGAESTIYTFTSVVGQVVSYINTSDSNVSYLVLSRCAPQRKVALLKTTDNGNTFTEGPVIYAQGAAEMGEGAVVNLSNRRMLGIFRDDTTSNYIQMVKSSDDGLTWSAPVDVVLGSSVDLKPTPKLIQCPTYSNRFTLFFYDRGDDRLKISVANHEDNIFDNVWRPIYLLGTSSNGNGDICVTDEQNLRYVMYAAKETGDAPPQTDTLWWIWKDIYNWV